MWQGWTQEGQFLLGPGSEQRQKAQELEGPDRRNQSSWSGREWSC